MGWRLRQTRETRETREASSQGWGGFPPYVSVSERQKQAAREVEKLRKKGRDVAPVHIEGRAISTTFWGKAWCQNLEHYSDFASRLPRGRSYVRCGAVVDLQIAPGKISALVRGTELYTTSITIEPVDRSLWRAIVKECSGKIESLIELLQGKLSGAVMEVITRPQTGLFPSPKQIRIQCSCPDWATLCKHVAAVLYGVGARLDREPELLFRLRGVDPAELVTSVTAGAITGKRRVAKERALDGDLASVFGIELDAGEASGGGARRGAGARAPKRAPAVRAVESAKPKARERSPRSPVGRRSG